MLASVCWEAGFVWLCGVWVCGIPRVVAWSRAWVCARVVAWSRVCAGLARVCVGVCGGAALVCAAPPLGGVLWRFPTLPHPLGCSTIGAAGLSFQVRNVAGRFPGAVTTTRLCRPSPPCWPAVWWGGGWVGRGSYSGCGFFVPPLFVAVSWPVFVGPAGGGCLVARPPSLSAPFFVFGAGGPWSSLVAVFAVWGGWVPGLGGLVWCRPISTSRLASASRRFHLWPIDPLFWRGPLTPCGGVETSSRSGLPA